MAYKRRHGRRASSFSTGSGTIGREESRQAALATIQRILTRRIVPTASSIPRGAPPLSDGKFRIVVSLEIEFSTQDAVPSHRKTGGSLYS